MKRQLSLATKLHLSLVPLGVTASLVTILTWTSLSSNSQELIETRLVKELAVTSLANLLVQDDSTKAMLLDRDSPALAARKVQAYDADMRALQRIGQLSQSMEVARLLKELQAIEEKDLRPLDTAILEALGAGKLADAKRLYFTEYDPARARYEGALRQLGDAAEAEAKGAAARLAAKNKRSLQYVSGALILGTLTAATVLVLFGKLAMNGPLRKLSTYMEVLQNGDFSQHVALASGDEFGKLAASLNTMADKLAALIGQVQKSGIQVNSSAREVAAMTQQQRATANEVAATTTEIGATSTEIYATSRELVNNVVALTAGAEATATAAGGSRSSLVRMQTTMQQLLDASNLISSKLTILSEKAGSISAVVTTIAKVADQTNLLSLNAAIEAEKAGEQGRGFSVVATEIRRLADQTAIATHDIEQIVKNMQSAVSAGVMSVDKFSAEVREGVDVAGQVSDRLNQIINEIQALTPNIERLKDGMQAQSAAAQQISVALNELSQSTHETVETLSQSNTTVEQLNDASGALQAGVSRFVLRS